MSKGSSSKQNRLYIILGLVLIFPIILICCICYKSLELKKYKHQLHLLDPSWACTTTYDDVTVILCDDNQRKLIHILGYDTQKLVLKEPNILDTISFVFSKGDAKRTLDISKTDQNLIKVDFYANKEYHIYIRETQYFDKIQKIASPQGLEFSNKKINTKK